MHCKHKKTTKKNVIVENDRFETYAKRPKMINTMMHTPNNPIEIQPNGAK
jgi:hypothetical protein